jgi:hypothetical protein
MYKFIEYNNDNILEPIDYILKNVINYKKELFKLIQRDKRFNFYQDNIINNNNLYNYNNYSIFKFNNFSISDIYTYQISKKAFQENISPEIIKYFIIYEKQFDIIFSITEIKYYKPLLNTQIYNDKNKINYLLINLIEKIINSDIIFHPDFQEDNLLYDEKNNRLLCIDWHVIATYSDIMLYNISNPCIWTRFIIDYASISESYINKYKNELNNNIQENNTEHVLNIILTNFNIFFCEFLYNWLRYDNIGIINKFQKIMYNIFNLYYNYLDNNNQKLLNNIIDILNNNNNNNNNIFDKCYNIFIKEKYNFFNYINISDIRDSSIFEKFNYFNKDYNTCNLLLTNKKNNNI